MQPVIFGLRWKLQFAGTLAGSEETASLQQLISSGTAMGPLAEELPPLSNQEALVESQRCLFCYDAPCTHACPTHIDIPRFIKKIATGNMLGSAGAILESNLLGATCARVCPVQELCEGACVLGAEHNPIMIGRLQRYSMDWFAEQRDSLADKRTSIFATAPPTRKKVAVIGAGPAGLSCAGELARRGHTVTVFEKRELPGGLSTYGIVTLREPVSIALEEVEMIRRLGVSFRTSVELCRDIPLSALQAEFDSVFIACGLGESPEMSIAGEEYILDGLNYIERSKLSGSDFSLGTDVVVIGAGNTAIDCATVARRLGARSVTVLYRRTAVEMSAYEHEFDFAKREGIVFRFQMQPVRVLVENGNVSGVVCVATAPHSADRRALQLSDSEFLVPADQIVKAIGQQKPSLADRLGLAGEKGRIAVDSEMQTSLRGIYAGGDAVRYTGTCSTVMAVQDGKLAAAAIHRRLNHG